MEPTSVKMIAASISLLPLTAVAIALGWLFSSAISAMGRNPSIIDDVKGTSLLYFALIEAIALFALVIALLLLFVF